APGHARADRGRAGPRRRGQGAAAAARLDLAYDRHAAAAAGEDGALPARTADLGRAEGQAARLAVGAEPALSPARARELPAASQGGRTRPRDAGLARRAQLAPGAPERELRARADGAV